MGKRLRRLAVGTVVTATMVPLFGSPASAISVELAKKCRQMAINAHPPPIVPGGKPYAQAERNFFAECVSKNGQMGDNGATQTPQQQK